MSDSTEPRSTGPQEPDPGGAEAAPPPWAPPAYGQPPAYGRHPAYGQAPYGGPSPYGPSPYTAPGMYGPPQRSGSALALSITAGILTVFCCSVLTLPSLILGIVALSKQSTDPQGSARLARYGWIAFGIGVFITVLAIIVFAALGAGGYLDDSGPYEGY